MTVISKASDIKSKLFVFSSEMGNSGSGSRSPKVTHIHYYEGSGNNNPGGNQAYPNQREASGITYSGNQAYPNHIGNQAHHYDHQAVSAYQRHQFQGSHQSQREKERNFYRQILRDNPIKFKKSDIESAEEFFKKALFDEFDEKNTKGLDMDIAIKDWNRYLELLQKSIPLSDEVIEDLSSLGVKKTSSPKFRRLENIARVSDVKTQHAIVFAVRTDKDTVSIGYAVHDLTAQPKFADLDRDELSRHRETYMRHKAWLELQKQIGFDVIEYTEEPKRLKKLQNDA